MGNPDMAMAAAIEEKMRPLRARYFEVLRQRMQDLERILGLLVASELSLEQDREVLLTNVHKLSGTGATYGFPQISKAAKAVEDVMLAGMANDDPQLLALVVDLMNVCHEVLANQETAPAPINASPVGSPVVVNPMTPAVSPEAGRPAAPSAPAAPTLERELPKMLVLDDDPSVLEFMVELFRDDAHIVTGMTADQGIELIRQHKPDLILLDNMMPGGVSGLSLLEGLQGMPEFEGLPVIMISASGRPDEVMRGLMAGAVDYITKPFDAHDMAMKVRKRLWRLQSLILVADDDESVRDLLVHKLRVAGCHVVSAVDGAQAWEILQSRDVSLAVLDLMMPGYDGMTLLRMMTEHERLHAVPVVFLTARHLSSAILEGLNTGAADYITKPFNSDEVVTRCTRLLLPLPRKNAR